MDNDMLKNASKILSGGANPLKFEFTEESINGIIAEAKMLSDTLFADRANPHDKIEYVRAHFGSLLANTLLSTWRNAFGLDKAVVRKSLEAILSIYSLNKTVSMPCIVFIQQVLPKLITPAAPGSKFSHELDEEKFKEYLRSEYGSAVNKAPQEVRERLEGKWQEHFDSDEGHTLYAQARKYLSLMIKIYYLNPPK